MEQLVETLISMGHTTTATRIANTTSAASRSDVQGEHLQSLARLVVAPSGGVFEPAEELQPGRHIQVGQVVGHLHAGQNRTPILSPFAGRSGEALAWSGERLISYQPVMWLSAETAAL